MKKEKIFNILGQATAFILFDVVSVAILYLGFIQNTIY